MLRRIIAIALIGMGGFASGAQSQAQPTKPENVAKAFFNAVAAGRWSEAAGYVDLDSFERFRQQMLGSEQSQSIAKWTADSLIKREPDMPRAVAEYQVAQIRKHFNDSSEALRYEFANVGTNSELAALSPIEAAARMIEAQDIRYKIRLSHETTRCVAPYRPAMPNAEVSPDQILGTIVRDSMAYVLHIKGVIALDSATKVESARRAMYRRPEDTEPIPFPPGVMQLRNVGGRWVILGGWGILASPNQVVVSCVGGD
jgi:hypothetical protein